MYSITLLLLNWIQLISFYNIIARFRDLYNYLTNKYRLFHLYTEYKWKGERERVQILIIIILYKCLLFGKHRIIVDASFIDLSFPCRGKLSGRSSIILLFLITNHLLSNIHLTPSLLIKEIQICSVCSICLLPSALYVHFTIMVLID